MSSQPPSRYLVRFHVGDMLQSVFEEIPRQAREQLFSKRADPGCRPRLLKDDCTTALLPLSRESLGSTTVGKEEPWVCGCPGIWRQEDLRPNSISARYEPAHSHRAAPGRLAFHRHGCLALQTTLGHEAPSHPPSLRVLSVSVWLTSTCHVSTCHGGLGC